MQSKRETHIEVTTNLWLGAIGSWFLTMLAMYFAPRIGTFWAGNLAFALCTVWSYVRGYAVRRYFNARQTRKERSALQYKYDRHPPY